MLINNVIKKPDDEDLLKPASVIDEIAYGPIKSRRLKSSLGVNLLGHEKKICNFNCPYCDLGFTEIKVSQIKKLDIFPTVQKVEEALREKIISLSKNKIQIDYITFSGLGEPTLYPDFLEAVTSIKKIRDQLLPTVKLGILSNGSMLNDTQVVRALNLLDERMIKLDAGNDELFEKIEAPLTRTNVARLIQGAKALKDVIIQTMFVQGELNNISPDHIDEWIESLGLIKPKTVHIYSIDRVTALPGLKPVPRQRLKEISTLLEKRTKIPSVIFS